LYTREEEIQMKKRGHGQGTIRQRTDGSWEGIYRLDGKKKSIYGKTEAEIKERLKKITAEITLGTHREPCKLKFDEWLDIWLWTYKHNKIKPLTFEQYERIIRLYIKPELGHIKMEELKNHTIQAIINKLGNTRNAQLTATITKMSLSHAVRVDMLSKNPAEYIIIPKTKKCTVDVLSASQRHTLIKALSQHRLGVAFHLMLSTGIRRGELLSLKWQDIAWKQKLLNVDKSLNRIKIFDADKVGKYANTEGTTKNNKQRIIPLLDDTIQRLKLHKHKQNIEKLECAEYADNSYIFCSKDGKPINPRNFTKYFHTFLKNAGIDKINLHWLRHTFATAGLENGIDMKIMQDLLGHSTMQVTSEIYSHVLPEKKKQEMEKLKNAFKI
jgi:integrase